MKPRLAAGALNRRIEIRRKSTTSDGHGGQDESWSLVDTVWAEAISQNGREAVLAGTLQGVSAWRIRIRWRSDMTQADQLSLDGKTLNIRSIEDPDGRREQLVVFADTAAVEV